MFGLILILLWPVYGYIWLLLSLHADIAWYKNHVNGWPRGYGVVIFYFWMGCLMGPLTIAYLHWPKNYFWRKISSY